MNIIVEYLYRDNNKIWGEALFSNKSNLGLHDLLKMIKEKLIDGEFLIAEQVGLTPLRFEKYDPELDHGWHEFSDIRLSDEQSGECKEDIMQFIDHLKPMIERQNSLYQN